MLWLSIYKCQNSVFGESVTKNVIRIISVLNAYYRHITKTMRIACVLKAYWANMLPLICSKIMYNNMTATLRSMKLKEAAKKVEDGIEETLTYCDFPSEHWTRIRTNNVIERLNREIRRRTRVVGTFPDGNSALMLVCARLRHVAGT